MEMSLNSNDSRVVLSHSRYLSMTRFIEILKVENLSYLPVLVAQAYDLVYLMDIRYLNL